MPDQSLFQLERAPIVEAILDVHCDLPPKINRGSFQSAAQRVFADGYPEFRTSFLAQHELAIEPGKQPRAAVHQSVRGFQALSGDKKQIVQSRFDGYSFNRLAPYTSLDDYLPEMKRCWEAYRSFAEPVVVRRLSLRYINRILLPLSNGRVEIDQYIRSGPTLPLSNGIKLTLSGFMHNHQVTEVVTGNQANIILAAQLPENDKLPVVLDIEAFRQVKLSPVDWTACVPIIASLRLLKNQLFRFTLTETCLTYLRQQS